MVGAHLDAEVFHRPRAYALRQALAERAAAHGLTGDFDSIVVCSDLWVLSRDELRSVPSISVGQPGVNALTAYLASRLPSVLAVEGQWVVQLDTLETPMAACWGRDEDSTATALENFEARYADEFLEAVALAREA